MAFAAYPCAPMSSHIGPPCSHQKKAQTMNLRCFTIAMALGLAAVLFCSRRLPAEHPENDQPAQQEGVEVLTRGPVHDAFAEPAIRSPRPTPVVDKKPPDPIE